MCSASESRGDVKTLKLLIGAAVIMLLLTKSLAELQPDGWECLESSPPLESVLALLGFVVTFFGFYSVLSDGCCCGSCLIGLQIFFLMLMLVASFLGIVTTNVRRRDERDAIWTKLDDVLAAYNGTANASATLLLDEVQQAFHCCGNNGPSYFIQEANLSLPASCCPPSFTEDCSVSTAWSVGCRQAISDRIKHIYFRSLPTCYAYLAMVFCLLALYSRLQHQFLLPN